jgi:peptide chain release factor 2
MNEILDRLNKLKSRLNSALKELNLEKDKQRLSKLERQTTAPDFWSDNQKAQAVMQEVSAIKGHVELWGTLSNEISDLLELTELTKENDKEALSNLAEATDSLEKKFDDAEFELLFSGEYDKNNAILSIHAGTGGTDAQDWAEILLRMYLRFAEKMGFKATVIQESEGEEAGVKSATVEIEGYYAYGYLKSERGVHRLVRLSPFNADHARQTSFALIEVIPEVEESKVKIDEKDLKIDTFRSSGHGGQSVNTTDSAVRITHLPTGLTATSQNERSQLQNKKLALTVLKSKIAELEEKKLAEEKRELKGTTVSAEWGNQIRSYVLQPYTMVKPWRASSASAWTA